MGMAPVAGRGDRLGNEALLRNHLTWVPCGPAPRPGQRADDRHRAGLEPDRRAGQVRRAGPCRRPGRRRRRAFVPWLRRLKAEIGITGGLAARGVTPAHLPRLVPLAVADFATRPTRGCTAADFEAAVQGGDVTAQRSKIALKIGVSAFFLYPDPARPMFAQDSAVRGAVGAALGHVRGALRGDGPVAHPTRPGVSASTTTRSGSTAWCCMAAPTSGPAATARRRCRSAGTATATATSTRSRWCASCRGAASRCSASAAACSCINVAFGGTLYQDIPTQRPEALPHRDAALRPATSTRGVRARQPAGALLAGQPAAHRSTACTTRASRTWRRLRRRGALPRRRHDRGRSATPARPPGWPACNGTPSSTGPEPGT
jgi:hypothetical protein